MTNFTKGIALASVLLAGFATSASGQVTNGSFESGLTGWTVTGSGVTPGIGITVIPTGVPNGTGFGDNVPNYDGTHAAYFVDDSAVENIFQNVLLSAGKYTLSFALFATTSGAGNTYDFGLSDSLGGDIIATHGNLNVPVGVWTPYSYSFTAPTTNTYKLDFGFTSGPTPAKDVLLDAVRIAAVPEPATWAMMVGGLALVGATIRRRKMAVSFV